MKSINMEVGKYYKIQQEGDPFYWIIHVRELEKNKSIGHYSCMTSKSEFYNQQGGGGYWGNITERSTYEEASLEDINWLQACVKADKWLEKSKMEMYEIY